MKRQEADAEHNRYDDDHFHSPVTFLHQHLGGALGGRVLAEDHGHPAVAHNHAQERQQEADHGQSHAVGEVIGGATRHAQVVAHRAVALDPRRGKVKSRRAEDGHREPHPSTDAPRHPAAAVGGAHAERIANAHVALHSDAGEEEDAAV